MSIHHFKKAWVRAVVAFLFGGVLREVIFVSTGDPNRPRGKNYNVIHQFTRRVYTLLTLLDKPIYLPPLASL